MGHAQQRLITDREPDLFPIGCVAFQPQPRDIGSVAKTLKSTIEVARAKRLPYLAQ